jgi:hypothetical protein
MQAQNAKKKAANGHKKKVRRSLQTSDRDGLSMSRGMANKYLVVPQPTKIVPDRIYTRLVYEGMGQIPIATGNSYTTFRWQPSAAYDVDPNIGSTATPGFAEFAAFYNNYRVTASNCRISVTNPSTVLGVILVVLPLTSDPGALAPAAQANAWPDNPYAKQKMIGLLGSPPGVVSNSMSTEKIVGSTNVYVDDTYASLTNGVPANNWYWGCGLLVGSAVTATISYTVNYRIEMGVEFYDRKIMLQ